MSKGHSSRRGQVTVETAVLFGFVVAGLVAMAVYLQRGVQGGMKSNADSFGTQFSSVDKWEVHSRSASGEDTTFADSAQFSNACQGVGNASLPSVDGKNCNPGTLNISAPNLPHNIKF